MRTVAIACNWHDEDLFVGEKMRCGAEKGCNKIAPMRANQIARITNDFKNGCNKYLIHFATRLTTST